MKRNKDICGNCKHIGSIGKIYFVCDENVSYLHCDFDEWNYMFPSEFYEKAVPEECPYILEQTVMSNGIDK